MFRESLGMAGLRGYFISRLATRSPPGNAFSRVWISASAHVHADFPFVEAAPCSYVCPSNPELMDADFPSSPNRY